MHIKLKVSSKTKDKNGVKNGRTQSLHITPQDYTSKLCKQFTRPRSNYTHVHRTQIINLDSHQKRNQGRVKKQEGRGKGDGMEVKTEKRRRYYYINRLCYGAVIVTIEQ